MLVPYPQLQDLQHTKETSISQLKDTPPWIQISITYTPCPLQSPLAAITTCLQDLLAMIVSRQAARDCSKHSLHTLAYNQLMLSLLVLLEI